LSIFVYLTLPRDLLHVKGGASAPRVGDLHLHAELCAEGTADRLHHVVLGRHVLEARLGQGEPVLVALDAALYRQARVPVQGEVVAQALLQEGGRLDPGLVKANRAASHEGASTVESWMLNTDFLLVGATRDLRSTARMPGEAPQGALV
jgi:hypothetical protein